MKKSILAIAVAASMAAPAAVMAAPTVYGNVHLSLNAADNDIPGADNNLSMSSNTSAIGVKGSEDLGDGLKAIYKVEFGIDLLGKPDTTPDTSPAGAQGSGALTGRDQFVGLKGGYGTIKFGTMSSNYKQMGGKVDPLYRTPLEGRGFLGTQSPLHSSRGVNKGRQTNTVQYVSPKMGGIELVANTTFSGSNDETTGLGVRWASKSIMVYADWIDFQLPDTSTVTSIGGVQLSCDNPAKAGATDCEKGTGIKVGGKFSAKAFSVAAQYEMLDTGDFNADTDWLFLAGTFNINKNNMIAATYGMRSTDVPSGSPSIDSDGYAVAYNHKLSKMTNVYVGYGANSNDLSVSNGGPGDNSMFTAGIKKKF